MKDNSKKNISKKDTKQNDKLPQEQEQIVTDIKNNIDDKLTQEQKQIVIINITV